MDSLDAFSTKVHAWLDLGDEAPYHRDHPSFKPCDGYVLGLRAIEAAADHEDCPPDTGRSYGIVIGVAGADQWEAVHVIPPGVNMACVHEILLMDPDVMYAAVKGWLPPEADPDTGLAVEEHPYLEEDDMTWTEAAALVEESKPLTVEDAPREATFRVTSPRGRWARLLDWLRR